MYTISDFHPPLTPALWGTIVATGCDQWLQWPLVSSRPYLIICILIWSSSTSPGIRDVSVCTRSLSPWRNDKKHEWIRIGLEDLIYHVLSNHNQIKVASVISSVAMICQMYLFVFFLQPVGWISYPIMHLAFPCSVHMPCYLQLAGQASMT